MIPSRSTGRFPFPLPALLLGLAGMVVVWLARSNREGSALTEARAAGVLRIGYAVEAPYAILTPEGEVSGESPEIARIIAARLGIPRVEWRLDEFSDLVDGLETRRFDVIAAGMFITPERQQRVLFSAPTFRVGPGLLVRKGNPLRLHSYADLLAHPNARVAALNGSVEAARLRQLGCPEQRLLHVPDAFSGRAAVESGKADALTLSAPTVRWMAQGPGAGAMDVAEPFDDASNPSAPAVAFGAFVFRRDEAALCRAWNAELTRFLGGEEHRRILSRFGFTAAELPTSGVPPTAGPRP